VPLFETSSQLQHGHELQSSPSSDPLLATSQYQPTIKQENTIPQSLPTSCPQVATVPPSGKFQ
jgi:hypothetical protein